MYRAKSKATASILQNEDVKIKKCAQGVGLFKNHITSRFEQIFKLTSYTMHAHDFFVSCMFFHIEMKTQHTRPVRQCKRFIAL